MHISNIVSIYDTQCLKHYIERRLNAFNNLSQVPSDANVKIHYHTTTTVNKMTSFILFLSAIPTVKSLPKSDRIFLCKHNIRPLILLNAHELDQLCYSEPLQVSESAEKKDVSRTFDNLFSYCMIILLRNMFVVLVCFLIYKTHENERNRF